MTASIRLHQPTGRTSAERVPFRSLVAAEVHRAARTRSSLVLLTLVVAIAIVMLIVRAILARSGGEPLGPEAVTLSADLVGFAVLLSVSIAVARDHRSGGIDLVRTLTPARPRHLAARAVGAGVIALGALGAVVVAGLLTALLLGDGSLGWGLADTLARTATATLLLAAAGVGLGAATRSTAAATFVAIALFWLVPVGLVIAGLTGAGWLGGLTTATLGVLASNAIAPGAEHWAAVGGIAVWTLALAGLGVLRETRSRR